MFRLEGPARSSRKNTVLAWYLAFIAGFVNSGGFVLIGTFTSHVTGHVGRSSIDLASGSGGAALSAALLAAAFFGGAFAASLIMEAMSKAHRSRAYGVAFLIESALLAGFILVAGLSHATHPRALDAEAALLCIAMGMQNALVTRLSGAVVRTTHLTGIFTDLAIESARWYRWQQARLLRLRSQEPASEPPPPQSDRRHLLITIIVAFIAGSAFGAAATARASRWAMLAPAIAILAASLYAFFTTGGEAAEQPSA